jgi:hypothetical protein
MPGHREGHLLPHLPEGLVERSEAGWIRLGKEQRKPEKLGLGLEEKEQWAEDKLAGKDSLSWEIMTTTVSHTT